MRIHNFESKKGFKRGHTEGEGRGAKEKTEKGKESLDAKGGGGKKMRGCKL